MTYNKSLRRKSASTHGLIVGSVLIVMALLVWVADMGEAFWLRYLNWAVVIGAVYYSMKTWRDEHMGGVITYSQALGYGVLVMFFASILFGFYNIIYVNYLDPESIQRSLDLLEEAYYARGMAEEQIELLLDMTERMQTPFLQAISTILGTTFLGLLISLIVALVVRKDGDPFQEAMRDVTERNQEEHRHEIE